MTGTINPFSYLVGGMPSLNLAGVQNLSATGTSGATNNNWGVDAYTAQIALQGGNTDLSKFGIDGSSSLLWNQLFAMLTQHRTAFRKL